MMGALRTVGLGERDPGVLNCGITLPPRNPASLNALFANLDKFFPTQDGIIAVNRKPYRISSRSARLPALEAFAWEPAVRKCDNPVYIFSGMGHSVRHWDLGIARHLASYGIPVYSVSIRGHGASEGPLCFKAASYGDHLEDVNRGLDFFSLRNKNPIFLGHSIGGLVAMDLAARNPDLCSALVLLNTNSPKGLAETMQRTVLRERLRDTLWPLIKTQLTGSLNPFSQDPKMARLMFFNANPNAQWVNDAIGTLGDYPMLAYAQALLKPLLLLGKPLVDIKALKNQKIRTIMFGGDKDFFIPAGQIAPYIEANRVITIGGGDHEMIIDPKLVKLISRGIRDQLREFGFMRG